jgi:predicted nucleotidyltransferase
MLTRKNLNKVLQGVYDELSVLGLTPERMMVFGSYARGNGHPYSDLDIAVWSKGFSGFGLEDLELYRPVLRKYPMIDLKTFPSGATAENFDPFIEVIEQTGYKFQPTGVPAGA